jgi:uncharacterized protein involved in response to NO
MGKMAQYPGSSHSLVMIGGFLTCFAAGFLMTAIPRFTGAGPAKSAELLIVIFAQISIPFSMLFFGQGMVPALGPLVTLVTVVVFAIRRFAQRKNPPPPSFLFLGIGLASGLIGLALLVLGNWGLAPVTAQSLGRLLFFQCFMLSLVVGVGGRLIPALLGGGGLGAFSRRISYQALAGAFVLSYLIEWSLHATGGKLLRAALVSLIAVVVWQIHKLPGVRSYLAYGIWVGGWLLITGLWGAALLPAYSIHFMHLLYIGGFGLMTLMIATRVVLAHGGYSLSLESRLPALPWIIGLTVFAAVTRLVAGLIPAAYETHLIYAAAVWIFGVAVWLVELGRRAVKPLILDVEHKEAI